MSLVQSHFHLMIYILIVVGPGGVRLIDRRQNVAPGVHLPSIYPLHLFVQLPLPGSPFWGLKFIIRMPSIADNNTEPGQNSGRGCEGQRGLTAPISLWGNPFKPSWLHTHTQSPSPRVFWCPHFALNGSGSERSQR